MTTRINLDMPHTVWVIVAKDVRGYRRGFEKCSGERFYIDLAQAINALRELPPFLQQTYHVQEAVIGYPESIRDERE